MSCTGSISAGRLNERIYGTNSVLEALRSEEKNPDDVASDMINVRQESTPTSLSCFYEPWMLTKRFVCRLILIGKIYSLWMRGRQATVSGLVDCHKERLDKYWALA